MLRPHDRRQLLDAFRPPHGYEFDRAVGTTFSLDLLALLAAPLAFSLFRMEERSGRVLVDPLAWIESLRRYADRIALFCQAGRINVPHHDTFLNYLESVVVEVMIPGRSFHPKFWALRFRSTEDARVMYRLLIASRNLTFDRSWDTLLVLEGELGESESEGAGNEGLAEFVRSFPRHALRPVSDSVLAHTEIIAGDLPRVTFDVPPGFSRLIFHPLGLDLGSRWPFPVDVRRSMIISPFLSPGALRRLAGTSGANVLLSRVESLDALSAVHLESFADLRVMMQGTDPEEEDAAPADAAVDAGAAHDSNGELMVVPSVGDEALSGLHAKVYIMERDDDVRVFTGSANATVAAFDGNAELLVELVGARGAHGIDAILSATPDGSGLADLLQPYRPPAEGSEVDVLKQELDDLLDRAAVEMLALPMRAQVLESGEGPDYEILLFPEADVALLHPAAVAVRVRPVTLRSADARGVVFGGEAAIRFAPISLRALTTFFAVELEASLDGQTGRRAFIVNVPTDGMPTDRAQRLLVETLKDRASLLRFLRMLLAEDVFDLASGSGMGSHSHGIIASAFGGGAGLFEMLVRTYESRPERLDAVARLVRDISARDAETGGTVLPEEFLEIWNPIWEARCADLGGDPIDDQRTAGGPTGREDHGG